MQGPKRDAIRCELQRTVELQNARPDNNAVACKNMSWLEDAKSAAPNANPALARFGCYICSLLDRLDPS